MLALKVLREMTSNLGAVASINAGQNDKNSTPVDLDDLSGSAVFSHDNAERTPLEKVV